MPEDPRRWKLLTEGSLRDLGTLLEAELRGTQRLGLRETHANLDVLRSKDGLIEVEIFSASEEANDLVDAVRCHWALLRRKGLAAASPVTILSDTAGSGDVMYLFRWADASSRTRALADPEVKAVRQRLASAGSRVGLLSASNEVYQGFDHERFPSTGGVELLRGKCTCWLEVNGIDGRIELDGENGFVIMHRGAGITLSDERVSARLMPVRILAHGADSPLPMPLSVRQLMENEPEAALRIRVEQNTELPQYGIIRANTADSDFPATAMWVVHWRIHTPVGTLITDPNVPLIFGPTEVKHYPPVGTEFFSSIGPVDVYNIETDAVVGRLQPGQLTAFDIVVTMDDQVPSIFDIPPEHQVRTFNETVTSTELQIPTRGTMSFDPLHRKLRRSK